MPAYAGEIAAWRASRRERLTAEDGWLSVVGLFWLEEGENAIGGDSSGRIVLPQANAPAPAGTLVVRGGGVTLHAAPGAGITADGKPVTAPAPLVSDAGGNPTVLRLGTLAFSVIERGGRLAVRVKDRQSEARRRFREIDAFPVDPAWRLDARFEAYDPPKEIGVTNIFGMAEPESSPGAVTFGWSAGTFRLDPILERGETDFWIIFSDLTSGVETYEGGRFVYVPPPVRGRTVLDFNRAYNPPCVFSPHTTCPLPPPQNRLPIRVEAGEKTYR